MPPFVAPVEIGTGMGRNSCNWFVKLPRVFFVDRFLFIENEKICSFGVRYCIIVGSAPLCYKQLQNLACAETLYRKAGTFKKKKYNIINSDQ